VRLVPKRKPCAFPAPFAGLDEAGRGCLAGPVVAAAVILKPGFHLRGLTDSKLLSPEEREALAPKIRRWSLAWGLGTAWPPEIDQVNILQASLAAMARAVRCLGVVPLLLAVDGNQKIPRHTMAAELPPALQGLPQETVVDGDLHVAAISAASVLAKVFRDRLMAALGRRYPGYGFAGHKGYATLEHYTALEQLGPCAMHRRTFRGVDPGDPGPEQGLLLGPLP